MATLSWYRARLRAMSLAEIALHARKIFRQWTDARGVHEWTGPALEPLGEFPQLPSPEAAPEALRLAPDALPADSAAHSRKDFTQHQRLAPG